MHIVLYDRNGLLYVFRFCLYSGLGLSWFYLGDVDLLLKPIMTFLARAVGEILSMAGFAVIILDQKVVSPGVFGIDIANECSAVSQMIIAASAILAYPATPRYRLLGLFLFAVIIFIGNILRLTSLFWIGVRANEYFDFVHFYVWGGLGYIGLLILLFLWMRITPKPRLQH